MSKQERTYKTSSQARNYYSIHKWIIAHYGKAEKCENSACGSTNSKRFEWALKKDAIYEKDITKFTQLCPSCHRKYDFTETTRNKMSKSQKGKVKPWLMRPIVATSKQNGSNNYFNSIREAAEKLGISKTGIQNALSGFSRSSAGFQWGYANE